MKVRQKLTLVVLTALLVVFASCGFLLVRGMEDYSLSVLVESQREKLEATGRAFRQVGTREDFEKMGELARDAWLKYQFGRCYQKDCALIKNGECIRNLTDYEIVNLTALKGEYTVQRVGGKQLLLFKQPLEYPEGFEILTIQDISFAWEMLTVQLRLYMVVFCAVSCLAAFVVLLLIRRLLSGLEELRRASIAISGGKLGEKAGVRSRDEIGQVAAAFNQMSETVEHQVEDLQLLLGALAHEMKTPLTSIVGYADSLLHVRLAEEEKRRSLEQIFEAGKRMEQLSSRLLSLIGMYDNESIRQETVKVKEVMAQAAEEVSGLLEEKGLVLDWKCAKDMAVTGDAVLLDSLLFNLLQNSCRASEMGRKIWMEAEGNSIRVIDQGCGIAEEDLPHVTKPFYMADKSRSREAGGSGLGLALCQKIAELHGAVLLIESRKGAGTVVTLTFTNVLHIDEDFAGKVG